MSDLRERSERMKNTLAHTETRKQKAAPMEQKGSTERDSASPETPRPTASSTVQGQAARYCDEHGVFWRGANLSCPCCDKIDSASPQNVHTRELPREGTGLLPCPFCGHITRNLDCISYTNQNDTRGRCENCGAEGPSAKFGQHWPEWNRRVPLIPVGEKHAGNQGCAEGKEAAPVATKEEKENRDL